MEDKVYVITVIDYSIHFTEVSNTVCKTLDTAKKMFREKINEYRNRVTRLYLDPFEKGTWGETGEIPKDENITPNSSFSMWNEQDYEGVDIWLEEKVLF